MPPGREEKASMQDQCVVDLTAFLLLLVKGELNLNNKWQSDDLFYLRVNEIHPRFNQFLSNFKDIIIYLKNLLTFEYRQNNLIPLSMVVGVSDTIAICQQEWPIFLRCYD